MTGVELAGGERRRRATSWSPTSCRTRSPPWPATRSPRPTGRCCGATATGRRRSKVDWALDGPIPWLRRGAPRGGHGPRRRRRAGARRDHRRSRTTGCPSGRSSCSASRRSPTRRARRPASTPRGPTRTARGAASTGAPSRTGTSSASRRTSSPTPPASATASSPATSSARPTSQRRNANLVDGDVGGGTYRLRQVLLRPMPKLSPYRTPVARALPRQRRRVPRRRRPRRARRRRGPCRVDANP